MLSIIVAKAKNNIIGKDNKLLWHLPADMERFKKMTKGHTIIMGRKTFESIGGELEDRECVVFTQNDDLKVERENVRLVHSMLEVKEYIDDKKEHFVIGGAMIFNLLMPHVKKMYVTEINKEFDGDTFFPKINEDVWKVTSREQGKMDEFNDLEYEFVTYERK